MKSEKFKLPFMVKGGGLNDSNIDTNLNSSLFVLHFFIFHFSFFHLKYAQSFLNDSCLCLADNFGNCFFISFLDSLDALEGF